MAVTGEEAIGRRERIARLRDCMLERMPEISAERARLLTESYKETDGAPMVIRRAKALEKILSNISVLILPDELIVGSQGAHPRTAQIFPEYCVSWLKRELDGDPYNFWERPGDRFSISRETIRQLKEIIPYWEGRTNEDRVMSLLPESVKRAREIDAIHWGGHVAAGDGHLIVDYEAVINEGLDGIRARAERALEGLDLTDPEDLRKRPFLTAVPIALKAAVEFARRYAAEARRMADREMDPRRKRELQEIASTCERVPASPATTFREALQSVWFTQLILQIESNGHSVSLGRFDQYMYPFYRRDVERGILTYERALELVQCFYVKLFSVVKLRGWNHTRYVAGHPVFQNITIGGQTARGDDAVNEVTYICLDAMAETKLTQPSLSARWWPGSPARYRKRCAEVIRLGLGQPALFNDEVIVPSLVARGVTLEDASNYAAVGCVEIGVPAKWGYCPSGRCHFNMGKVLELALNNGRDRRTGIQLCPGNGDLASFKSFDEVMEAWRIQAEYYLKQHIIFDNLNELTKEELVADVFCSALLQDCIGRGKTIHQGGAVYDFIAGQQCGTANVADSLAAIKKLVFEERVITGTELARALETNFEGPDGERVRQLLLNKAPKFGNDDDYVDLIARDAFGFYVEKVNTYKTVKYGRGPTGGMWQASTSTVSANVPSGLAVGATPDGRKAGDPLAEGCSPAQGRSGRDPGPGNIPRPRVATGAARRPR
jgi:formate C-acetyltransferase